MIPRDNWAAADSTASTFPIYEVSMRDGHPVTGSCVCRVTEQILSRHLPHVHT